LLFQRQTPQKLPPKKMKLSTKLARDLDAIALSLDKCDSILNKKTKEQIQNEMYEDYRRIAF